MFVIAQILGGIAILILLGYTIMKVNRGTILACTIAINLLWALHYLLLKAYTGCVCSLICVGTVAVFFFKGKIKLLSGIWVPIFFGIIYLLFGILTWENKFSLLPILCSFLVVIALWNDREIVIKSIFIVVALLWVIYNSVFFSYIGMIGQGLSFLFNALYVIKYYVLKKRTHD